MDILQLFSHSPIEDIWVVCSCFFSLGFFGGMGSAGSSFLHTGFSWPLIGSLLLRRARPTLVVVQSFSVRWLLFLWSMGFRALGLSSWWCTGLVAPSMWDFTSQTRDGPTALALAGGFLTAGPPGKSLFPVLVYYEQNSYELQAQVFVQI